MRNRYRTAVILILFGVATLLVLRVVVGDRILTAGVDEDTIGEATVLVQTSTCGLGIELSTGFAVDKNLILTAAHPLVDADTVSVKRADSTLADGTVVHLDTERDIAVIATDPRDREATFDRPLKLYRASSELAGTAILFITPDEQGFQRHLGHVIRATTVTLDGAGRRQALELAADIRPGNSGAAVVRTDGPEPGSVIGMVFATARSGERGWAVASSELVEVIDNLGSNPEQVGSRC